MDAANGMPLCVAGRHAPPPNWPGMGCCRSPSPPLTPASPPWRSCWRAAACAATSRQPPCRPSSSPEVWTAAHRPAGSCNQQRSTTGRWGHTPQPFQLPHARVPRQPPSPHLPLPTLPRRTSSASPLCFPLPGGLLAPRASPRVKCMAPWAMAPSPGPGHCSSTSCKVRRCRLGQALCLLCPLQLWCTTSGPAGTRCWVCTRWALPSTQGTQAARVLHQLWRQQQQGGMQPPLPRQCTCDGWQPSRQGWLEGLGRPRPAPWGSVARCTWGRCLAAGRQGLPPVSCSW